MSILQGTIPDDWEGEYCCYAVYWPNSPQWLAILRGVLSLPARGRFWDENTGNIINAQNVIRETYDNNLHLKGVLVACDDPGLVAIALALTKLAEAQTTNGSGCCDDGGSAGAPGSAPPFIDPVDSDPQVDPPPDGFDSWEQFYANKCSVAYAIISKLEADLVTMAAIQWGTAGAEAITASLLILLVTPIPAAAVIAVVFFLLTVGAVIVATTALSIITANEGDLVCALYSGTSSEHSRTLFMSTFSDLVDSGVTDPVDRFSVKVLMGYIVSASVTNQLYARETTLILAEQDCSQCHEVCETCIRRYDKDFNPVEYLPIPVTDWSELTAQGGQGVFTVFFASTGPDSYRGRFRSLVDYTPLATPDFILRTDNETEIYAGDSFEDFASAADSECFVATGDVQWFIRSSTPFTVECKFEYCY